MNSSQPARPRRSPLAKLSKRKRSASGARSSGSKRKSRSSGKLPLFSLGGSTERANHAVATLCRVAGVSVSGFYAWLRAIPAVQDRAEADAELGRHIDRIFAARRRVYGSPRIHAELRREGRRHGRR